MKLLSSLFALVVACLYSSSSIYAQPPASSPALDPHYIVLEPTEKSEGVDGSVGPYIGAIVNNVGPLEGPNDIYGDVFLDDLPTGQSYRVGSYLYRGGPQFHIRNNSAPLYHDAEDIASFTPIHIQGYDRPPALMDPQLMRIASDWLKYEQDPAKFIYTGITYDSIILDTLGYGYGAWLPIKLKNRSFQDLIVFGSASSATKPAAWLLTTYQGSFPLDTIVIRGRSCLRPHAQFHLPTPFTNLIPEVGASRVLDIDRDGVLDILSIIHTNGYFFLYTIFGKQVLDSEWSVDTVTWQTLPFIPSTLTSMDFLHEDGLVDLLISSVDTIYCVSSKPGLMRTAFDFTGSDLKIPSPARLDPRNFQGGGRGLLDGWGQQLFDLGDVSGSGAHALGTVALNYRDTALSLAASSYLFIYSGGRAADERADAVVYDNSSPDGGQFAHVDTIQTGPGDPMGFLIGDPGYYGGQGLLWFFKGDRNIPHSPDPRWLGVSQTSSIGSTLRPQVFGARVRVTLPEALEGRIIIRNLLGNSVKEVRTTGSQSDCEIDLAGQPSGLYIMEFQIPGYCALQKFTFIHP